MIAWSDCTRPLTVVREASAAEYNTQILKQVVAIFEHAGCQTQFVSIAGNINRIHRMLADGQLDVLIEASYRQDRLSYAKFSVPYRIENTYLFALSQHVNKYKLQDLRDLKDAPWRVIDQGKAWYGPDWELVRTELRKANRLIDSGTGEGAIRDLKLGRAELVIATDLTMHTSLTAKNGVLPLALIVHQEPVRIMFSRLSVSDDDIEAINQAIYQLHPDVASLKSMPKVEATSTISETN